MGAKAWKFRFEIFATLIILPIVFELCGTVNQQSHNSSLIIAIALSVIGIWVSVTETRRFEIPDLASVAVGALTIVALQVDAVELNDLPIHVGTAIWTLVCFLLLGQILFDRLGQDAFGAGDAKLFAASALLFGPLALPSIVFISATTGAVFGFIVRRESSGVPLGPFIFVGLQIVCLWGPLGQ